LLSMAGIPPFVGFFSKYLILIPILYQDWWIALAILLFHLIATFNYLRFLKDLWFDSFEISLSYYTTAGFLLNLITIFLSSLQIILPLFFLNLCIENCLYLNKQTIINCGIL
jgi:NADH-quinone oxidoreductase subunit N